MKERALQNLLELLAIEGPTGQERLVAAYLTKN